MVPPHYDSLLCKVIIRGADRAEAIDRMIAALEGLTCEGVPTTIPMHLHILRSDAFRRGDYDTRSIPGWPPAPGLGSSMAFVPLTPIGGPLAGVVDDAVAEGPPRGPGRARGPAGRRPRRGPGRLGPALRRAGPQEGQADRARAPGPADRSRHPAPTRSAASSTTATSSPATSARPAPASSPRSPGSRAAGCMVIANDNTVASGAWWPRTPEKIQRAQTMALRLRLPTIYLVDCSGLFLPEQSRSFPGRARRRPHLQDEQPAQRPRRAPDRRGLRRLHRRRRLHADHQRPGLHDRAGLHGHRRGRAHQGRQEPEDDLARHRRARGPRPPLGLRRRPGSGRRDPAGVRAARGRPPARLGGAVLPRRPRPDRDRASTPASWPRSCRPTTARPTTPTRSWPAWSTSRCSGRSCPRSARR